MSSLGSGFYVKASEMLERNPDPFSCHGIKLFDLPVYKENDLQHSSGFRDF